MTLHFVLLSYPRPTHTIDTNTTSPQCSTPEAIKNAFSILNANGITSIRCIRADVPKALGGGALVARAVAKGRVDVGQAVVVAHKDALPAPRVARVLQQRLVGCGRHAVDRVVRNLLVVAMAVVVAAVAVGDDDVNTTMTAELGVREEGKSRHKTEARTPGTPKSAAALLDSARADGP